MKTNRKQTGRLGEEHAAEFLQKKGYEILERNWRYSRAEVDIIARHEEILVFIEVKTRTSNHLGEPEDFVTQKQLDLLAQAAPVYMEQTDYEGEIRFDVIGVLIEPNTKPLIRHYPDTWFPEME